MKNLVLYLLLLCPVCLIAKNVAPNWVDAVQRENIYPSETFYTGFASTKISKNEDKSAVYERIQNNARVAAVSSIQVSVDQTIERFIQNAQSNGNASTIDVMTSVASSQTHIKDIPGLQVETWENPKKRELYAFAWVNKSELSKLLARRIVMNRDNIAVELNHIDAHCKKGDKMQAKKNLPKVQTMLEDIEKDQRVMISIDPSLSDADLLLHETQQLKERFRVLSTDLKNGIAIYLNCDADLFSHNYPALKSEIQGELSAIGCTFVNTSDLSEWSITITSSAREYTTATLDRVTTYTSYVDATIIIDKVITSQRVYENQISQKGVHTHNYEQAARQAYKDLSSQLSAIIKEQMQQ